jgi:hypothetical protein
MKRTVVFGIVGMALFNMASATSQRTKQKVKKRLITWSHSKARGKEK